MAMSPNINSIVIWDQLRYFNRRENWGDISEVDVRLLHCLDNVRGLLKRRIYIHCCYEMRGHSPNSFHKVGMAVDFDVEGTQLSELFDLYRFFRENWFSGGVGIYPYWNNPGLHLDIRPHGHTNPTWLKDKEGKYIYSYREIVKILTSFK